MPPEKKLQLLALGVAALVAFLATVGAARWLDDKDQQDQLTDELVAIGEINLGAPPLVKPPKSSVLLPTSDLEPTQELSDQQSPAQLTVIEQAASSDQGKNQWPEPSTDSPALQSPALVFTPMPAIPGERVARPAPVLTASAQPANNATPQFAEKTSDKSLANSPSTAPPSIKPMQSQDAFAQPNGFAPPALPKVKPTPNETTSSEIIAQRNMSNAPPKNRQPVELPSSSPTPNTNSNRFDPSFSVARDNTSTSRFFQDRQVIPASGNDFEKDSDFDLDLNAPAEPPPPNPTQFGETPSSQTPPPSARVGELPSINGGAFVPRKNSSATNGLATVEPKPNSGANNNHDRPHVLLGTENFKLAEQPAFGEHYRDDRPITGPQAHLIEPLSSDFSPGPNYDAQPYISDDHRRVYEGKKLYSNQRPLVELGRPWYQLGPLSPGYNWFGKHNNIAPQFLIYGDYRSAIASNSANGDNVSMIASELNLDIDLKLTGTERFHAFVSPLDDGLRNTRYLLDEDRFQNEFDANIDFGYFEGDLGSIVGGFVDETLPFDMPFAIGVMPLLMQNGVWMEDAFLGFAATIPARNSRLLNISNMDTTFFAGYDKISSDAFPGDDSAARMYGVASFIEAMNGYFEIDYAFFDDRSDANRSYHNVGFGYTRRFGRLLSNSTRVIVNAGQSSASGPNTADGVLLISENSLITGAPSTVVPYFNFFAGFDRPQSAARAAQAGGVLRNTGILFETDGMTDYPTLDATANDTYGGALGLNLIADDFSQQLVVEMAMLGVMGNDATRNAPGEQIGLGFRYQLPLTNSIIFRADGMYGFLNDQADVRGLRFELRHKW